MLTVKECLEIVKVSKYIIFLNHDVIGCITREIFDEQVRLVFSEQRLLNYLSSNVFEIIPSGFVNDGFTSCNLVLDCELPFD